MTGLLPVDRFPGQASHLPRVKLAAIPVSHLLNAGYVFQVIPTVLEYTTHQDGRGQTEAMVRKIPDR